MGACLSAPTAKHAYILSWISVISTVIAAAAGILLYETTGSSLCLVFGLENSVDLFSSIVVLWRFFCPEECTPEVEKRLKHREQRASVAISIVLLLLGFGIVVAAIDDFTRGQEDPEHLSEIIGISFVSILIFGVLTLFKFSYSFQLESASLYKDGVCSLIGTVTSGALFVNALIIEEHLHLWWIDPTVATICGVGAFLFGTYTVCVSIFLEGANLCSISYWTTDEVEFDGPSAGPDGLPATTSASADEQDLELTQQDNGIMT